MRVLVTGHQGYIGTCLVPMLRAAGHDVAGLDSGLFSDCTFQAVEPVIPETIRDIRDVTPEDLDGFDALIHLAALCNDPLGDLAPALTAQINHAASVRLARLAKAADIGRFLFASSCSVYGASDGAWADETAPLAPLTPYARSKIDVERDVSALADDTFSPVFLRNATAFGVSPRLRFDLVINNLTAWAYCTGRVLMKSDGKPWRPLIHVADIAAAFVAALEAPREAIHNQALNVGSNDANYRIAQLAGYVEQIVPGSRIGFSTDAGPDRRSYRVDFGKIGRVLPKFCPRWTAQAGVEELYGAYRSAEISLEGFEGPRFARLAHLRQMMADRRVDDTLRPVPIRRTASCNPT